MPSTTPLPTPTGSSGKTIDWLKGKSRSYDPAMLYLSDHGESLGEFGLFLHGVPYNFAPDVQKRARAVGHVVQ